MSEKKRLGILGGTFNPVHNGHLAIADTAYYNLHLDRVLLVPAYDPPHKAEEMIIPFEERIKMVGLAVEEFEYMEVSDLDHTPGEKSYTKHLIQRMSEHFPDTEFYFIIGEDNIPEIASWFDYEWLLQNVKFVAVTRKKISLDDYRLVPYLEKIIFLEMEPVDISSSLLRDKIARDEDITGFLPDNVRDYIRLKGFYRG